MGGRRYARGCSWVELHFGRTFRAEELPGDVESFAADNDNLLAIEELFGDDAGQTTEEVSLAVAVEIVSSRFGVVPFRSNCCLGWRVNVALT